MRTPASPPAAAAFAGAALSLLACPAVTLAQSNALQQRLENATRIECSFEVIATGTWEDAGPTVAVEPAELEAAFFDIDVEGATAEAEGPYGNSYIVVRYAQGYLHFMQMAHAGPLHVTTVLAQATTDGRLKAVHTRHEYSPTILPGFTSRPEMYVGDCAVEE